MSLYVEYSNLRFPRVDLGAAREKVTSAVAWLGQKCRRFSLMASQAMVFALDVIFLAGKASDKIPEWVTKGALTALSTVGLVALPYNVDLIRKNIQDAIFSFGADHKILLGLASAHALELTSNCGLVLTGLAAAIEGSLKNEDIQKQIYQVMTPWGIATLAIGLGITISYLAVNHFVLKKFREEFNESADGVVAAFVDPERQDSEPNPYLAAQVRFCMDKDTLAHFLEQLKEMPPGNIEDKRELMRVVIANIETQQKISLGGQLGLTLLGYILMAVEKYYTPNSLVSASINLSVASLYAIKQAVETLREVYQRHRISQFSAEALKYEQIA